MNINAQLISKLVSIQKEQKTEGNTYFNYNKLLILAMAIQAKKITSANALLKELSFKEDELKMYIEILGKEEFLSADDIKFIAKIGKKSKTAVKNFTTEVEEVLVHLNRVTGRNFRVNKTSETRIKTLLMSKKYTVSDFKRVNLYFTRKWGVEPKMAVYLRPTTLYNGTFDTRLEEADMFFAEIEKYKNEIQLLCSKFGQMIAMEIYPKDKLLAAETEQVVDFCDEMPLNLKLSIVHWLKQGYKIKDIITTIEMTEIEWAKKAELRKHISVSKILDQKFPDRIKVVGRLLEKKSKPKKSGVSKVENWINKQNGGN